MTQTTDSPSRQEAQRKAPFGLGELLLIGLFLGAIGVGIAAALNWRRFHQPQRVAGCIGLCLAFLLLHSALAAFIAYQFPQTPVPLFFIVQVVLFCTVGVVFAWFAARQQRAYFRDWVKAHGGALPMVWDQGGWRIYLAIIAPSLIAGWLYFVTIVPFIWTNIALPLVVAVTADTVYSDPAFNLTYPGYWYPIDRNPLDPELCQQSECLLTLAHKEDDQTWITVVRQGGILNSLASLGEWAYEFWNAVDEQSTVAEFLQPLRTFELAGQPAQEGVFYITPPPDQIIRRALVTKQANGPFLMILVDTAANTSPQTLGEIEAIISSIQFR